MVIHLCFWKSSELKVELIRMGELISGRGRLLLMMLLFRPLITFFPVVSGFDGPDPELTLDTVVTPKPLARNISCFDCCRASFFRRGGFTGSVPGSGSVKPVQRWAICLTLTYKRVKAQWTNHRPVKTNQLRCLIGHNWSIKGFIYLKDEWCDCRIRNNRPIKCLETDISLMSWPVSVSAEFPFTIVTTLSISLFPIWPELVPEWPSMLIQDEELIKILLSCSSLTFLAATAGLMMMVFSPWFWITLPKSKMEKLTQHQLG